MKKGLVMSTLMQLKKSGTVRNVCSYRSTNFAINFAFIFICNTCYGANIHVYLRVMVGSPILLQDCASTSIPPTQGNESITGGLDALQLLYIRSTYVTGTEDGSIHRCSVSYNEQYLDTYAHHEVLNIHYITNISYE